MGAVPESKEELMLWQRLQHGFFRWFGDPCRVERDFSAFNNMSEAELLATYDEMSQELSTMLTDRYRRLALFLAMKWRQERLQG